MTDSWQNKASEASSVEMAHVVERNIRTLIDREREQEGQRSVEERVADAFTRFTGSMPFVYIHLLIFGLWIAINAGWLPLPKFDPSFAVLAVLASTEAIFLSTFVLISQNRMAAMADARAKLDLQISLLAEHEVTQILKLVADIAKRTGVDLDEVAELSELAKDVHPATLTDTIETAEIQSDAGHSSNHKG